MTTDNENARPWPEAGVEQADDLSGIVTPLRRPCRICRVRDRPVVPIGCAAGWDMCFRCYSGVSYTRRRMSAA